MIKGLLGIPWFAWAALALALAVLWVFVGPHTQMPESTDLRYLVIRWGHALTWLLLAISFFLRGLSPELASPANLLAMAGGLVYAAFLGMTLLAK